MAILPMNGTIYGDRHSHKLNYLYIVWQESGINADENTSTVTATVYLSNEYGFRGENPCPWTLDINSQQFTGNAQYWGGTKVRVTTQTVEVEHDEDGSKTVEISASFNMDGAGTIVTAAGMARLATIPQYPVVTQTAQDVGPDSMVINWTSDKPVDGLWFSTNGGKSWTDVKATGDTEGYYTVRGLTPGKTYEIKTKVRAKETGLVGESQILSVSTLAYPNVTLQITALDDEMVWMQWVADAPCDHFWSEVQIPGREEPFTWDYALPQHPTSGLTMYGWGLPKPTEDLQIKVKLKRLDSQLVGESNVVAVRPGPDNGIWFSAVPATSTPTSLTVEAEIKGHSPGTTDDFYAVDWKYYRSNYPGEEAVCETVMQGDTTSRTEITGLYPGTYYYVTGILYRASSKDNTVKDRPLTLRPLTMRTGDINGTFYAKSRSGSLIEAELKDVEPINYLTKVNMYYKKRGETEWIPMTEVFLEAGETRAITHVLSPLIPSTVYEFKATITRMDLTEPQIIKSYYFEASTLTYTGDEDILPHFVDAVVLPYVGKACVKAGLTKELPSGLSVKLYKVTGLASKALVGTFDQTMTMIISETAGSTVTYKLQVEDGNGNVYGESTAYVIAYPTLQWTSKVRGDIYAVTAAETRPLADAMTALYRYKVLSGIGVSDTEKDAYTALQGFLSDILTGKLIKRTTFLALYDTAQAFLGQTTPQEEIEPLYEDRALATAAAFNILAEDVISALETMED